MGHGAFYMDTWCMSGIYAYVTCIVWHSWHCGIGGIGSIGCIDIILQFVPCLFILEIAWRGLSISNLGNQITTTLGKSNKLLDIPIGLLGIISWQVFTTVMLMLTVPNAHGEQFPIVKTVDLEV